MYLKQKVVYLQTVVNFKSQIQDVKLPKGPRSWKNTSSHNFINGAHEKVGL